MTIFNIENYNNEDFNATYSPEDNKLRLYAGVRIDGDDWQAMKDHGWRWAPKQELFFAYWSVNNEDFCLALAGDILPEEMTIVERAEAKADRLLLLAQKRSDQCLGYQQAANDLMHRLDNNQPILSGHHSEKKADRQQKQLDRTIEKAHETAGAVGYWVWRAQGVIGYADHKNNFRTVSNRIKTLQKELRDNQKVINEAAKIADLIIKVKKGTDQELKERNTKFLAGNWSVSKFKICDRMESGELTTDQALDELATIYSNTINSKKRARVINHVLNRLAYEQGQLSLVSRYDGELKPAIIQTFLRAHGADKPKAEKTDYGWLAVSSVCLPLHLASSTDLELDDQEWRDLMQSVGYEVPTPRTVKAKAPLLNLDVEWLTGTLHRRERTLAVVKMTKEEYKRNGKDHSFTIVSKCGGFRFRAGYVRTGTDKWGNGDFDYRAVFISDSKAHPLPESIQAAKLEA